MAILEPAPALPADVLPLEPSPLPEPAAPREYVGPDHEHGVRCYWDFRECRWVCAACAE